MGEELSNEVELTEKYERKTIKEFLQNPDCKLEYEKCKPNSNFAVCSLHWIDCIN